MEIRESRRCFGKIALRALAAASFLALAPALQFSSAFAQAAESQADSPIGRALEHQAVPMRDGVRLDTSIYLPKGTGPFPVVLVRSPYPIERPDDAKQSFPRKLLEKGYALAFQNERGMYLSEGRHEYMANAGPDGYDTLTWIAKQPWSTGKIGTYGCSSTAEDQLALIALNHPAHQAAIVLGFGAGIGKIGPYAEQGNIYRGGALQLLFAGWFKDYIGSSGPGADQRPTFPSSLTPEDKTRLSKLYSLRLSTFGATKSSTSDLIKYYSHLPVADLNTAVGGPVTDWDQFAKWSPGDPRWSHYSFANEGDTYGVPAIWGVSWYDVSVGPNLYLYDYVRKHIAAGRPANEQFLIASPGTHCSFQRQPANKPVGERDIGDASYDFDSRFIEFLDWKLKGIRNGAANEPQMLTYQMGENRWLESKTSLTEDPNHADFFLASQNGANSVYGDGTLLAQPSTGGSVSDSFLYDPRRPVQTLGGGACCMGELPAAGSYDQAPVEARHDVLVYSTPPLEKALRVRGAVDLELYVASDAPDTDITVKLTDVYPDGRSYNLDDTIFRLRYRDGYDHPQLMQNGKVYKVVLPPMFTANTFLPGHRIRLQITSSNFPRFDRNLNTGAANSETDKTRVARNSIYHSAVYPSRLSLSTD
jgi:putative CocE/NonD family hydrolase